MKNSYSFQRKEKYLYLIVSGEYDKTAILAYPGLINQECEKEKVYKVLVNALDLKNTDVPAMDRFFMGEEIAKAIGSKIKLAIAWPQKDIDKFAENVAVNRGSDVYVVGDIPSAEKWLLNIN